MVKRKGLLILILMAMAVLLLAANRVVILANAKRVWQKVVVLPAVRQVREKKVSPTPQLTPTHQILLTPTISPTWTQSCKTENDCPKQFCQPPGTPCPQYYCIQGKCQLVESSPPKAKACIKDSDCVLMEEKVCQGGCEDCQVLDLNSPLFDAFNKTWCQQNQPKQKACPHCDIQRTNQQNLKAKCVNNICTKTNGELPSSSNITWEEAKLFILRGQVKEVYQTHSLLVTLILKNGIRKTTTEPKIDAVFDVVRQCGKLCSDIISATE